MEFSLLNLGSDTQGAEIISPVQPLTEGTGTLDSSAPIPITRDQFKSLVEGEPLLQPEIPLLPNLKKANHSEISDDVAAFLAMLQSTPQKAPEAAQATWPLPEITEPKPLAAPPKAPFPTSPILAPLDTQSEIAPFHGPPQKGNSEEPKNSMVPQFAKLVNILTKDQPLDKSLPILNAMNGSLEKLPAKDIPKLIFQNQFLSEVFSSPSIPATISEKGPLESVLKKMGVGNDAIAEIKQSGIDTGQLVSPSEILAAFGIEPKKAVQSLESVKQNIETNGVEGYLKKSVAFHGQKQPLEAPKIDPHGVENLTPKQPVVAFEPPKEVLRQPPPISPKTSTPNAIEMPYTASQIKQQSDSVPVPVPNLGKEALSQRTTIDPTTTKSFDFSTPSLSNNASSLTHEKLAFTKDLPNNKNILPTDFKLDVPPEAFIPANGSSAPVPPLEKFDLQNTPVESPVATPPSNILVNNIGQKDHTNFVISDEIWRSDFVKTPTGSTPQKDVPTPTQVITPSLIAREKSFSSESESSFGRDRNSSKDSYFSPENLPLASNSPVISSTKHEIIPQETKQQDLSSIREKIVDHASFLAKDGGGVVQIDLGKEHGNVNLSLEFKNQEVEIKIITPTQESRDALSHELYNLKESLQQHNIDLKNVEIGVRSNSFGNAMSFQNFNQNRPNKNDLLQDERFSTPKAPSLKNNSISSAYARQGARHLGQIQVLI